MYKLFLCLRYLRSRVIAYFAVLAVALCVAMMLIVSSVMNGFLDKIEHAAKGLFGDIVVETGSLSGLARYDEFIAEVVKIPEVEAASPFILTYGILRIPRQDLRLTVQVAGIRLPERAFVSDFEEGLFVQRGWREPTFDPPVQVMLRRLRAETEEMLALARKRPRAMPARLGEAISFQRSAAQHLRLAAPHQAELARLQARLDKARAELYRDLGAGDTSGGFAARQRRVDELRAALRKLERQAGMMAPELRMVLGLGLPVLSQRAETGRSVRVITCGHQVALSIVPLGRTLGSDGVSPNTARFTVVDDCRTDVWSVDSKIVYVPFRTLQRLNHMDADVSADDPPKVVRPPRCSQIHVKTRPGHSEGRKLRAVRAKVERLWKDFHRRHPEAVARGGSASVLTWRQRQAKIIAPIESQRTLVITMFGIISLVSVALIFVIFYMIVFQKTRDIGVLKAVGASSRGVAGIFLAYGAAIGGVGSILGTIGGTFFVRNINPIHDWIGRTFGLVVWSKETFLFERIPNAVDVTAGVFIVIGAIVAGLVGALIPSLRAARMQPVEALRYE